jgi:hypothetical protein
VVLDNIEIMFPKHGLTDCQLGLQALDQLQKQQDDEPVIVRNLFIIISAVLYLDFDLLLN